MNKQAISVTLKTENLLWLRGRVRVAGVRSVSEVLDGLVASARAGRRGQDGTMRSVKGTIQIAASDPDLAGADAAVRALFAKSHKGSGRRQTTSARRDAGHGT